MVSDLVVRFTEKLFTHQALMSYSSTATHGRPLPVLVCPVLSNTVGVVQTPKAPPSQRLEMLMPAARLYSSSLA